jgi:hypothetical protein
MGSIIAGIRQAATLKVGCGRIRFMVKINGQKA